MITVLLADDEPLIRTALRAVLGIEPDMTVVGEATTGAEVLPLVRQHRPDVVLMDVRMPDVDGIQATRHLLETFPEPPKVIVLTTFGNDDHVYDALRVGAQGFLLKRTPPDEIVRAVRLVATGDSLLFPAAVRQLALGHVGQATPRVRFPAELTEREREVLRLMAEGLTNAEIAGRLYLGLETVKTHVSKVLAKLGARDRTQAVIIAYESGFMLPR